MILVDYQKLAELLFPHIDKTIEDYEAIYPQRELGEEAKITRFAPSPTGFLHIGGLFAALISERIAHQSGGKFILRIEDTDKKREVDDGVSKIIEGLKSFGIQIDEGFVDFDKEEGASATIGTKHLYGRSYRPTIKIIMQLQILTHSIGCHKNHQPRQ